MPPALGKREGGRKGQKTRGAVTKGSLGHAGQQPQPSTVKSRFSERPVFSIVIVLFLLFVVFVMCFALSFLVFKTGFPYVITLAVLELVL